MILITGSKGLIGQKLKKQLTEHNQLYCGMDIRYEVGHSEHGDIENTQQLESIIPKVSGIVHLAGVSRVVAGQNDPELCWRRNVIATQNILQIAQKSVKTPWIIYASSREVYGQQDTLPVCETAGRKPLNVYARSKVAAEDRVMEARAMGLQTAIVRFSNVYGSVNDYPDRVIPAFCRAAAQGGTIRIDGASNTFDFTHVDDVVPGVIRVIEKLQAGCQDFQTTHFTSGQPTTLLQAAEYAKQASQRSVSFQEAPSRTFDVSTFFGDPKHALEYLGWKTTRSVSQGMASFVQDFEHAFSSELL